MRSMHPAFAIIPIKQRDLLAEYDRLKTVEKKYLANLAEGDADAAWLAKTARASAIESLYTGMEGILKVLVAQSDGAIFQSGDAQQQHSFHMQLLAQAMTATDKRPSIITDELYGLLDELRKFRHVERNHYGNELLPDRVETMMQSVVAAVPLFVVATNTYIETMSSKYPTS
jgi:hypothetical protein